jgi:protein-tyrosine phosphatase
MQVNMKKEQSMRILMVCLGNICRSPLAEGIMKHKLQQQGLNWEVDSAGTGAWHIGELPDPRSISTARKNGIDITDQRARQFKTHDLTAFDLILTMDASNHSNVLRLATNPDQEDKVKMIMNFVEPEGNQSVPDPYWDDNGFDQVFAMLDEACDRIIEAFHLSPSQ